MKKKIRLNVTKIITYYAHNIIYEKQQRWNSAACLGLDDRRRLPSICIDCYTWLVAIFHVCLYFFVFLAEQYYKSLHEKIISKLIEI